MDVTCGMPRLPQLTSASIPGQSSEPGMMRSMSRTEWRLVAEPASPPASEHVRSPSMISSMLVQTSIVSSLGQIHLLPCADSGQI